MEDLLASIRKAIDSDVGEGTSSTAGETRGTLMRGALREMRVNLGETKAHNRQTAEEIAELRGRILRNATEVPPIPPPPRRPARPMVEPHRQVPPPPRNDFRGILAGQRVEPRRLIDSRVLPHLEPPPAIRGRTLQDEFDEITYGSEPEPPQRHATYAEQPMHDLQQQAYDDPDGYYQSAPPQPRMLSNHAEAATQAAFRHLSETMFAQGMGGRSLEDVTRELLRGMLKQWLDDNLPPLVERLVRDEIARVARNGR